MTEKNSSRRVEFSLKRTRFLGHPGLIAEVFRELEIDKLIDEKLPKERDHNVPYSVGILTAPESIACGYGKGTIMSLTQSVSLSW
mgnify:CR=1 FL=1|jgi:hypothetical protein